VKNTLVVNLKKVENSELAQKYGVDVGCALMEYDFALVTEEAVMELRHKNASEAMVAQSKNMQFVDGLPIPDVD
jgi:hypothetical protein